MMHRAALGALVGAVLLSVAVVSVHYGSSNGPVSLMSEAKAEGRQEILAAKAQQRLAGKDFRIFKSMELAAQKKMESGAITDREFLEAKNKQEMLDERLEQLTQRFNAQKQALEYMVPNTEKQAYSSERMANGVKSLKQALGKLTTDVGMVEKAVQKTKDEVKPVKAELKTSDEIMEKSSNAYQLFGQRVQQSRQKAELARQQVNQLDQGAMLAQQYATQMRAKAVSETDKKKAELVAQDASEADTKVDMLKKQSAEAMQSSQLFDAEADEAASYMSMFGADAQQAHVRQSNAAQKLQYLSAEYEKGQQLEELANQKKNALEAQLMEASRVLGSDVVHTKEDETAVLTGERSTVRTGEALKIDRNAAMKNTATAMGELKNIHKDEQLYYQDASQARDVEGEADEHKFAAEHLDAAAEASRDEARDSKMEKMAQ